MVSTAPRQKGSGGAQWRSVRTSRRRPRVDIGADRGNGSPDTGAWQAPPPGARTIGSVTEDEIEDLCGWTIGRLQEELVHRLPAVQPPAVAPSDGIDGILELLEHIRAADT